MRIINWLLKAINSFSSISYLYNIINKFFENNHQVFQLTFDFLISIGTLFAVYIALFQKRISMSFGGPKLNASVSNYGGSDLSDDPYGNKVSIFFSFLSIQNEGYSTATNVKCKVRGISASNSHQIKVGNTGKLNYRFAKSLPWHLEDQFGETEKTFEVEIFPNEEILLNFVCREINQKTNEEKLYLMEKGPIYNPGERLGIEYVEGSYEELIIELQLFCENSIVKPQYFKIVHVKGEQKSIFFIEKVKKDYLKDVMEIEYKSQGIKDLLDELDSTNFN